MAIPILGQPVNASGASSREITPPLHHSRLLKNAWTACYFAPTKLGLMALLRVN